MRDRGGISSFKDKRGKTRWRIRISINGKIKQVTRYKGVRLVSEEIATEILRQMQADLVRHADNEEAAVAEYLPRYAKENLVSTLAAEFLKDYTARFDEGTISENTLRNYQRVIPASPSDPRDTAYFRFFDGMSVYEVGEREVRSFKRHMERRGLEPGSVKLNLALFHSFLVWCQDEERIKTIPKFPKVDLIEKTPDLLTPREQRQVLDSIPWDRRGIFLALCLGIRPNAARALLKSDVVRGGLAVRRGIQGMTTQSRTGRSTKARKENWVPMTRELAAWVEEFGRNRLPTALLFWNPAGRTKSKAWVHVTLAYQWDIASAAAGVRRTELYKATKHSFATGRLLRGKSKDSIAEFMQVSPRIVETYAKWAREMSASVLDDEELSEEARAARDAMLADGAPAEPWSAERERERETARVAARTAKRRSGYQVANAKTRTRKPAK